MGKSRISSLWLVIPAETFVAQQICEHYKTQGNSHTKPLKAEFMLTRLPLDDISSLRCDPGCHMWRFYFVFNVNEKSKFR